MQLVIYNNLVQAVHDDSQIITKAMYPNCQIVSYQGNVIPGQVDPRTSTQKATVYRDQRRVSYPSIGDQLDMIYWDQVNGTKTFQAAIAAVKAQYPKVTS
jgi:hypothetical protein